MDVVDIFVTFINKIVNGFRLGSKRLMFKEIIIYETFGSDQT